MMMLMVVNECGGYRRPREPIDHLLRLFDERIVVRLTDRPPFQRPVQTVYVNF